MVVYMSARSLVSIVTEYVVLVANKTIDIVRTECATW